MVKECFISLGELNKKWLFYLSFIFIAVFKSLYEKFHDKTTNFFFILFLHFLSFFFNGFIIALYLIIGKITGKKNYLFSDEIFGISEKKEEGEYLSEKQKINNSTNKEKSNKKSDVIKWLFISSLFYAISHILDTFIKTTQVYKSRGGSLISISFLLRIIIIIILSNKLIKYIKIYKHHYVSIIVIFILILIINIYNLIFGEVKKEYKGSLKVFIENLFISCNYVIGAVYLNKSKGNVLLLCFCTSIFIFISIIFLHIIKLMIHDCNIDFFDVENPEEYCKTKNEFKNFYDDFDKFKNINTYFYLFLTFLKEFIKWHIIYFFSPNHFAAISSIEIFLISLIEISNEVNGLPIYLISSLLIIFFIMVYNEMIILRFCGLEKNTKVEISKRAKEENLNIDSILNEEEEEEENQKVEIGNYQIDMNNKPLLLYPIERMDIL